MVGETVCILLFQTVLHNYILYICSSVTFFLSKIMYLCFLYSPSYLFVIYLF